MLKSWSRSPEGQKFIGSMLSQYILFVERTTRYTSGSGDSETILREQLPTIFTSWHGQHGLLHRVVPRGAPIAALISRHGDGGINAAMLQLQGVIPIRGSGGPPDKMLRRGGMVAMREMLRMLEQGISIGMTADVPKVARRCGMGVVTLAQLSGRPIVPVAVATRNRINFASWDRASLALPFGKGAQVIGAPLFVARHADAAALEAARFALETELDHIHARAHALVGRDDPGAGLVKSRYAGMAP